VAAAQEPLSEPRPHAAEARRLVARSGLNPGWGVDKMGTRLGLAAVEALLDIADTLDAQRRTLDGIHEILAGEHPSQQREGPHD
jgi:hypothetical protein